MRFAQVRAGHLAASRGYNLPETGASGRRDLPVRCRQMATQHRPAQPSSAAAEPLGLVLACAAGLLAVLFLPRLAPHLPHPGRTDQARWALTATGILVILVAALIVVGSSRGFSRAWMAWTSPFALGLTVVKFVLSPSAYSRSDKSLNGFVASGLVAMLLYEAALLAIAGAAQRSRPSWALRSKISLAVALAGVAVGARFIAASALGTTSAYAHSWSRGTALLLPAVVIVAAIAVMQSFQEAGERLRAALSISIGVVLATHALWVVYMYRLFR